MDDRRDGLRDGEDGGKPGGEALGSLSGGLVDHAVGKEDRPVDAKSGGGVGEKSGHVAGEGIAGTGLAQGCRRNLVGKMDALLAHQDGAMGFQEDADIVLSGIFDGIVFIVRGIGAEIADAKECLGFAEMGRQNDLDLVVSLAQHAAIVIGKHPQAGRIDDEDALIGAKKILEELPVAGRILDAVSEKDGGVAGQPFDQLPGRLERLLVVGDALVDDGRGNAGERRIVDGVRDGEADIAASGEGSEGSGQGHRTGIGLRSADEERLSEVRLDAFLRPVDVDGVDDLTENVFFHNLFFLSEETFDGFAALSLRFCPFFSFPDVQMAVVS